MSRFSSFRQFYPYYLQEHRNRTCRRLHFIGSWGVLGCLALAMWQQQWPNMSWYMFAAWYSEGAKVFDADGNFVDEPALRKILEINQTLYKEKLVVEDIMTLPGEGVPSYASGRQTFMVVHDYNHNVANDPAVSKIAGKVRNAIMPGATRSTMAWTTPRSR